MAFTLLHGRRTAAQFGAPRGFTLIEMLVVMTLLALLLTLAVPRYFSAIDNGRLNVQRQNLATLRDAIDKFYGDQGKYPAALDELVTKRYLRQIPVDPVTKSADSWVTVANEGDPDDPTADNGVKDVKSGAPGTTLDGTSYGEL